MKKLFALGLSLMMAASLTCTAFAATTAGPDAAGLTEGEDYEFDQNNVRILTKDGIKKLIGNVTGGTKVEIGGPATDEDKVNVANSDGTLKSDEDFYVTLPPLSFSPAFADKNCFKVKFDKDDNKDRIRYALITEKRFGNNTNREVAFRFILKETPSDEEFKISGTATFTAKKDIALLPVSISAKIHKFVEATPEMLNGTDSCYAILKKGGKIEIPVQAWVKNEEFKGDHDMKAGDGGIVVKPTKNDDNEINWEDENKTIANLKFEGNDDPDAFYPKLSTKWYPQAPYTALFADQDAYIYNFMGNPAINSTARATLELYNPYVNSDDELEIAPEDVFIYQVVDGQIKDVTSTFKAGENDGGDPVFTARVRQLGTYILAEQALVVPAAEVTPAQAAE